MVCSQPLIGLLHRFFCQNQPGLVEGVPRQGSWKQIVFKVPPNPNRSMTLFYDSLLAAEIYPSSCSHLEFLTVCHHLLCDTDRMNPRASDEVTLELLRSGPPSLL